MEFFAKLMVRRAGWVALLGSLLGFLGVVYSAKLYKNLRTNFEELLPNTARSVLDLNQVSERLRSIENLGVLIFSKDTKASKRLVDDLAEELEKAPKSIVASVEYEIQKELAFFKKRQALYMEVSDLIRLRDYIGERIEYEKALYNPLNIFSEIEIPEPQLDFIALRKKYSGRAGAYERLPGGYYATPDETIRAVLVYLPAGKKGVEAASKLKSEVEQAIARLNPTSYAPDIEIKYTGGVQDFLEEHHSLIEDLEFSTIIVVVIVAIAMLFFYRSVRSTIALNLSLFMGTFWTFGVSYFAVGYLNANSAFLGSIVIGNGINFGIILLARYIEERRHGNPHLDAMVTSMTHTATSTWTAALAAGLSYGSLILTDFRGFRQFGIIGLIGMVLCWLSAFTLLPAYLTLFDRVRPLVRTDRPEPKPVFAGMVAGLVNRFPGAIWAVSVAITLASLGMLTRYTPDILETNVNKLRNKESMERGSGYLNRYMNEIFQRYLSPLVVMPQSREEARAVAASLRERQRVEGTKSFIANVQTLDDFLPTDQEKKIGIIRDIRRLLPEKFVRRLSDEDRKTISEFLTPEALAPIQESDLPPLILEKFTEKDGSVGRLVLVEPPLTQELTNGNNLISFIDGLRKTSDEAAPGSAIAGTLAVSSDMIGAISRDGPRATLFAFLAVVILVILLFRNLKTISLILFSLMIGMLWLAGLILGYDLKINFLNFIALPITFGIGVDYGVNMFARYRTEGAANILRVIQSTGGAVALCSFTTVVGYGSLLIAGNQGFVSFGTLAVVGELTTLIAALISLPAFLLMMHRRQLNRETSASLDMVVSEKNQVV